MTLGEILASLEGQEQKLGHMDQVPVWVQGARGGAALKVVRVWVAQQGDVILEVE